jgi:hypothetical protein
VTEPDFSADREPGPAELPVFHHPEWMVGIVLISGVFAILAGLVNPVWWLTGSPFILALAVWLYGRIRPSRTRSRVLTARPEPTEDSLPRDSE